MLLFLSLISICVSMACMVVTCFSIRKINLWALWSILAAVIIAGINQFVNRIYNKIGPVGGVLQVTGILFIILLAYISYNKNARKNNKTK